MIKRNKRRMKSKHSHIVCGSCGEVVYHGTDPVLATIHLSLCRGRRNVKW
jgi:ribosomal protein L37E